MNKKVKLWEHQQDAVTAINKEIHTNNGKAVGRVVIPTGGGKTVIQATVMDYVMDAYPEHKVSLVVAPRIVLVNQHRQEFSNINSTTGAIVFHSGKAEYDRNKGWEENSTTNIKELKNEISRFHKMGKQVVVFSTFHSVGKLAGVPFDTIIFDESQYCIEYYNDIIGLFGNVKLFFTATERYTKLTSSKGHNNTAVYGERLYEIKPAYLIERGVITPPKFHFMFGNTSSKKQDADVDMVINATKFHIDDSKKGIGHTKIIFALNGTNAVKTIADNIKILKNEFPEHKIFTITSNKDCRPQIDGKVVSRQELMSTMKECSDALIFHYDILTEGIDVDGITGVVIDRGMSLSKMQQTIGRSLRLYKKNPDLKKHALISFPIINGESDVAREGADLVMKLKTMGFDVSAENIIIQSLDVHIGEEEGLTNRISTYIKNSSESLLDGIFHYVEDDESDIDVELVKNISDPDELISELKKLVAQSLK